MPTMRDVAQKAGVALCTVSRVLNGSANVAEETKKNIEQAMKELNYIPNELARGMFRKKSGIVAMLIPDINHHFFSNLAGCIEKELYEKGYKLMLCTTNNDLEREREQVQFLRSNIVDGVISAVASLEDEEYQSFHKPMVMLDHSLPNVPFVVSDHEQGGSTMADFFIARNRKKVVQLYWGYQGRPALSNVRQEAFERSLKAAGIEVSVKLIDWSAFDFYKFAELSHDLLREQPDIDGFVSADIPSAAFLKAAQKKGLRIPEDITIVACDGTYVVSNASIEITSIVQDLPVIAKKSVSVLLQMINGDSVNQIEIYVPVRTHMGDTT